MRHNTIIYRYLRQSTNILVFNTTLFYTWRHVSADYTAIFRPTYNRTVPYYIAPNMGSHIVYSFLTTPGSQLLIPSWSLAKEKDGGWSWG